MSYSRMKYDEDSDSLRLILSSDQIENRSDTENGITFLDPDNTIVLSEDRKEIEIIVRNAKNYVYNTVTFPVTKYANICKHDKYFRIFEELSILDNYAFQLASYDKVTVEKEEIAIALMLFTKICLHSRSIYRLTPINNQVNPDDFDIWDYSTICSIARCIIDAYCAIYYLVIDDISIDERILRNLIWNYHSEKNRLDYLYALRSQRPEIQDIQNSVEILERKIRDNEHFQQMKKDNQKKILRGVMALCLTNTEITEKAGICKEFYKNTYDLLSQHIHSYPHGINSASSISYDNDESLHVIATTIEDVNIFLSFTIRDFLKYVPWTVTVPSNVNSIINKWVELISDPNIYNMNYMGN
jgi:hypothetical protein